MTRQTNEPLVHHSLHPTRMGVREWVERIGKGEVELSPPYQRGEMWSVSQKIALVESWLRGNPTGVIVMSDRSNDAWAQVHGDVYESGAAVWAVVDGKQRLLAAREWFGGRFAIPASWLAPAWVERCVETEDGPYVRFTDLTEVGRLKIAALCVVDVSMLHSASSVAHEAAVFVLVNGGGVPQSEATMTAARRVAAGR
ncbi:DUF262 domain-containing protein [Streptomyces noursei]